MYNLRSITARLSQKKHLCKKEIVCGTIPFHISQSKRSNYADFKSEKYQNYGRAHFKGRISFLSITNCGTRLLCMLGQLEKGLKIEIMLLKNYQLLNFKKCVQDRVVKHWRVPLILSGLRLFHEFILIKNSSSKSPKNICRECIWGLKS